MLWLERGSAGSYVERSTIAIVLAAVLLVLPVKRYVNVYGTHDAMSLIPFYKLLQASSPGVLVGVYSGVVGAAAVAFALLPRRALRAVPVVLLVALAAASVVSSRFVVQQARTQEKSFVGSDPRWIDHNADGPVAYLYSGETEWNLVWETLFWNDRVDRVYDLAGEVPGPLPQTPAEVQPDGTVFVPPGSKGPPAFAAVSPVIELVGTRVAHRSFDR